MILGPTEHRVARYLADLTRSGRVTLRTVELAERLGLERSEAYRITARLRVLGLFGIENDRGGSRGGRRLWRTAIEHDGQVLDAVRHRAAWARIVAWARARRSALQSRLEALRSATATPHLRPVGVVTPTAGATPRAPVTPSGVRGGIFADAMRRHGLGPLMDEWARSRR
ncbi:MAG TPA: hypothetical protein VGQ02_10795 [Candidatus Limnocylindrales bacterium]|nr:hypothetical protein [Candidatus Limnocylindrales bacterium]